MARFITISMLFIFSIMLSPFSMFMLSIEKGRIYIELYDLKHIINVAASSSGQNSQKIDPVKTLEQNISHCHLILSRYTIPENPAASCIETVRSSTDFSPAYPTFSRSLRTNPSLKQQFLLSKKLKFPITSLLQSSVLLI